MNKKNSAQSTHKLVKRSDEMKGQYAGLVQVKNN